MAGRRNGGDAEIRAFIDAAPAETPYSDLVKQIINRFGAGRAWSRAEIESYCCSRYVGRPWQRSRIEADPEVQAFIDDHLWRVKLDRILEMCHATFGEDRMPSRTGLARYSRRRIKQLGI